MPKHYHDDERELQADVEFEERGRRPKPLRCEILHEDESLFVVSKPAGMFVEGGLFDDPGVAEQLMGDEESAEAPEAVVPLEHDASGVMLLARDSGTLELLQRQFDDGEASLTVLAIVRGVLLNESGVMENLVTSPKSGKVKVTTELGDPARTEWKLRDSYIGFALLECIPRTRLEQQIRAQLTYAGLPLAVDPVHGGAESLKLSSFKPHYRPSRRHPERPLISRPTLHAWKLRFTHPGSKKSMEFESTPPKDFKATVNQLDRFGRIRK